MHYLSPALIWRARGLTGISLVLWTLVLCRLVMACVIASLQKR